MFPPRLLAFLTAVTVAAEPGNDLQVLSVSPTGEALPTSAIQVIFDRPVAGSLDRTVDAAAVFRIEPRIEGRAEWRDPVTLRFVPAHPLQPGVHYQVTVANTFQAMDGTRLAQPYQYDFTVRGPRLLGGLPVSGEEHPRFLAPDAEFEVVFSSALAPDAQGFSYLDFNQLCRRPGVIRLNVVEQRPVREKDPWQYQEAGGRERDPAADSLRRVVRLRPEQPLPLGCTGELVVSRQVDREGTAPFERWKFSTYGPLRLAEVKCAGEPFCPTGGVRVVFSTPVRGAEVERRVRLVPETPFTVSDTTEESADWYLEARLVPRTGYALQADPALRDVFGQRIEGDPSRPFRTTGYAPNVDYEFGMLTVERAAFRTLAIKHVNVDTLVVSVAPVPDSLIPGVLRWNRWNRQDSTVLRILRRAADRKVAPRGARDRVQIYGLRLPFYNAQRPGTPVLQAVRVTSPSLPAGWTAAAPVAIVQVTDLGVHARIGEAEGAVWVTGVSDGRPRPGATVTLYDGQGRPRATARTDADGLARLTGFRADTTSGEEREYRSFEGYVVVTAGNDRAITTISQYDPDLSPWRFNVRAGWGTERLPVAAAVFTERGIYRPGEPVYAKAIVRSGTLGNLLVPARSDSLHWVFADREGGVLRETTVALTAFGTSDQTQQLAEGLPLGTYQVRVQQRRNGHWTDLATTSYRVAEYRPPQFLVELSADSLAHHPGDSVTASVEARYLFGAPMGRAALSWVVRQSSLGFPAVDIRGTEGYFLGETGWWWEEDNPPNETTVIAEGKDTLDAAGRKTIRFALKETFRGRPAEATIEAGVTDVNRQAAGATAAVVVHPASFYLGAKPLGAGYFWSAGTAESVGVIAVRPDGGRLAGVRVTGTMVRREWHQVHRTRAGYSEISGDWVSDTVAHCSLTTEREADAICRFTPAGGGSYILGFTAADDKGREVSTSLYRWAVGKDWVPWNDETQFKMDVIPDKNSYAVGDTATVLFASPFTDADAWVTVEREGLIEQRRIHVASGSTTLKFPVLERWAPNAFVSILVARGRSAPPGPLDDPGRPTIRVGYAEVRVTPEVKRLQVEVSPLRSEYRPGDTARVRLRVRDRGGKGQRSEVTLWAVDQGVLALTGYRTPDPVALLYPPRGLGLRLASNLTTVAPQVPEGEKGGRAPGGGGGIGQSEILRSRFKSTAFFLASVLTDPAGNAVVSARLPDNLTTFRVMAVAVTAGDRYGSGESPLLVTRPLVARPALPRFARSGDRFTAGVVVNRRGGGGGGGSPAVSVQAEGRGIELVGEKTRSAELEAGRGREVRFEFHQPGNDPLAPADSTVFRFRVTGAGDTDAVEQRLAVKPAFRPRAWTVAGVLTDTATAQFQLPAGIDPDRSRLQLSVGSSPLAVIRGLQYQLQVYPYYCSEQVASAAEPIIALYRAQQLRAAGEPPLLPGDPRREIETAVLVLAARQREDGGIGLWSADDWTTPWLSAFAGLVLLDARSAGVAVSDSVLERLGRYLRGALTQPVEIRAPVIAWYQRGQSRLSDQVAAADYLSRLGHPEVAAENDLLRNAAQLTWEDRLRLAEVLARRKAASAARALVEPAWRETRVEGRRAVIPPLAETQWHYFPSRSRPVARLLLATLAVDSNHALLGPLTETLVQQGRAGGTEWQPWNTQDYAAAVSALVALDRRMRAGQERAFTVSAGGRPVLVRQPGAAAVGDSAVPLTGLLGPAGALRLSLAADSPGPAIYYYLTVTEVPRERPVDPSDGGIRVERWYEKYDTRSPTVSVTEGELLRVRLRITVPEDRDFVVVDDPLPAGLEPVDLSLRTASLAAGPGAGQHIDYLAPAPEEGEEREGEGTAGWYYGSWDSGWWSPFDHREIRDDRVVYAATVLWKGTYTMTYLARATTPGTFIRPPAQAEELYNPAVYGRSDGGTFTVTARN